MADPVERTLWLWKLYDRKDGPPVLEIRGHGAPRMEVIEYGPGGRTSAKLYEAFRFDEAERTIYAKWTGARWDPLKDPHPRHEPVAPAPVVSGR